MSEAMQLQQDAAFPSPAGNDIHTGSSFRCRLFLCLLDYCYSAKKSAKTMKKKGRPNLEAPAASANLTTFALRQSHVFRAAVTNG
eukprot:2183349-Pleurochrysis_carterae.AAC.1